MDIPGSLHQPWFNSLDLLWERNKHEFGEVIRVGPLLLAAKCHP